MYVKVKPNIMPTLNVAMPLFVGLPANLDGIIINIYNKGKNEKNIMTG